MQKFFFLLTTQVVLSCQFEPTISTECTDGLLTVKLHTKRPFRGIIYAQSHRSTCYAHGEGENISTMRIPLVAIKECGLRYDPSTESYHVILHARQHRLIILEQDRTFNVTCDRETRFGITAQAQHASIVTTDAEMGFIDPKNRVKKMHLVYGQPYDLLVRLIQSAESDNYKTLSVRDCVAFGRINNTLKLIDAVGCSLEPQLISHIKYEVDGSATANVYKMFRFEKSEAMHVQCAVDICRGQCTRTDCYRRRDTPLGSTNARRAIRLNADAAHTLTSTTVLVHDAVNVTEVEHHIDCADEQHYAVILCAVFGILLVFTIITNIVFCHLGGFCCCYRTPANSKAPSEKAAFSATTSECSERALVGKTAPISTLLVAKDDYNIPIEQLTPISTVGSGTLSRRQRPGSFARRDAAAQQQQAANSPASTVDAPPIFHPNRYLADESFDSFAPLPNMAQLSTHHPYTQGAALM